MYRMLFMALATSLSLTAFAQDRERVVDEELEREVEEDVREVQEEVEGLGHEIDRALREALDPIGEVGDRVGEEIDRAARGLPAEDPMDPYVQDRVLRDQDTYLVHKEAPDGRVTIRHQEQAVERARTEDVPGVTPELRRAADSLVRASQETERRLEQERNERERMERPDEERMERERHREHQPDQQQPDWR